MCVLPRLGLIESSMYFIVDNGDNAVVSSCKVYLESESALRVIYVYVYYSNITSIIVRNESNGSNVSNASNVSNVCNGSIHKHI